MKILRYRWRYREVEVSVKVRFRGFIRREGFPLKAADETNMDEVIKKQDLRLPQALSHAKNPFLNTSGFNDLC